MVGGEQGQVRDRVVVQCACSTNHDLDISVAVGGATAIVSTISTRGGETVADGVDHASLHPKPIAQCQAKQE
jgi:propanediol dehydratase large subunit